MHVAPDNRRSTRTVYLQLGASVELITANQLLCTVVSLAHSLCKWKWVFFNFYIGTYNNKCFSFSLSCISVTELCRSHETTCTSNFNSIKEMHFRGQYNVTVSAKTASWEAFSDRYEIIPSTIRKINSTEKEKYNPFIVHAFCIWLFRDKHIPSVKITRPEVSITTISDRLLVKWKILSCLSEYLYHCQVKYRVCHYLSNEWNKIPEIFMLQWYGKQIYTILNVSLFFMVKTHVKITVIHTFSYQSPLSSSLGHRSN